MRRDPASARQVEPPGLAARTEQIDRLLPQTQCRRCGYDGCRPYAEALAAGAAAINRCPPGGAATLGALARLLQTAEIAPDPACGEVSHRRTAHIDNSLCIGCTKCILACPVDAIVGAPKHQHHVLADRCTGCDLCLPPCPVDCIAMTIIPEDWSGADAARGRIHHQARRHRLAGGQEASSHPDRRDPLAVLSAPGERSRRLARILARVRGDGAA
jgi:Na+-translocating ferredoxin:NAD+ oxidoreductase subunit B